jgi:hypothetical protein
MPLKPLIICISPHQDDIALSTSSLLHELYTKNSKIICKLISCFTRTNYAPYLQNKSIESISRERELEDKRYAKKLALDTRNFRETKLQQVNQNHSTHCFMVLQLVVQTGYKVKLQEPLQALLIAT